MGHYRRLYESADAARRAMIVEAAHWQAEAEKTLALAKRERERGDNLQREVQRLEAEVARWKAEVRALHETPAHPGVVKMLEQAQRDNAEMATRFNRVREVQDEEWQRRYDAAMKRVDELKSEVRRAGPAPEGGRTMRQELEHECEAHRVTRLQLERERDEWHQTANELREALEAQAKAPTMAPLARRKLPDARRSLTIKLRINRGQQLCPECSEPLTGSQTSLHLMLGYFDDGTLGELFVKMDRARRGSAAATFADEYAKAVSFILQHGLPIAWVVEKARRTRDESAGVPFVFVDGEYQPHPVLKHVGSTVDYIAAVLERVLAGKPADRATPEEAAEMAKKLAEAEVAP